MREHPVATACLVTRGGGIKGGVGWCVCVVCESHEGDKRGCVRMSVPVRGKGE